MLINETAAQSGMSTKSQVLDSISFDQISEVSNVSVDVSSEALSNVCNESSNGKILGNFQRLRRKSIQWVIKKRQSIHWLDKLFPDKIKVDKEADNEDVISREESDLRIIWFLKLMAIFLSLLILGLILTIIILLIPHQPTVIQPKIPKKDIFYRYDYRASENIKAFDIPL